MWSIVVHGGAGATASLEAAHRRGCRAAAERGARVLAEGGSARAAVVAAVVALEDDPAFNAGVGSVLDEAGQVRTDAALMWGPTLALGAVGAVAGIRNPIRLAEAVLDDGRAALLVGAGAVELARRAGIPRCDPRRLEVPRPAAAPGTVGAVARDRDGHVAAATSTGGIAGKLRGRVGDSPIAGAGTYADDALGAVSATGHGETILRAGLALRALLGDDRGDLAAHLRATLEAATARVGGRGGLIAVRPDGRWASCRNTPYMGTAWVTPFGAGDGFSEPSVARAETF